MTDFRGDPAYAAWQAEEERKRREREEAERQRRNAQAMGRSARSSSRRGQGLPDEPPAQQATPQSAVEWTPTPFGGGTNQGQRPDYSGAMLTSTPVSGGSAVLLPGGGTAHSATPAYGLLSEPMRNQHGHHDGYYQVRMTDGSTGYLTQRGYENAVRAGKVSDTLQHLPPTQHTTADMLGSFAGDTAEAVADTGKALWEDVGKHTAVGAYVDQVGSKIPGALGVDLGGLLQRGHVDADVASVFNAGTGGGGGAPSLQGGTNITPQMVGRQDLTQTAPYGIFQGAIGAQDQTRQGQLRNLDMLEAAARGDAPSFAELQGRRQIQQAIAGQHALASSGRGGAGMQAMAHRRAASNAARMTADAAGQAAMLRAREAESARRLFSGALGQARGQDIDVAGMGLRGAESQMQSNLAVDKANQAADLRAQEAELDARLRELGIQTQYLTAQEKNQLVADLQAQELNTKIRLANEGLLRDDRDALLGGAKGLAELYVKSKTAGIL